MNDDLSYFSNIDNAINLFTVSNNGELYTLLENDDEVKVQIALLGINQVSSIEEAEK